MMKIGKISDAFPLLNTYLLLTKLFSLKIQRHKYNRIVMSLTGKPHTDEDIN